MKSWIKATAMLAILAMTAVAGAKDTADQAKGKHAKGDRPLRGVIQSVSGDSIVITAGGKKNPHQVTIKTDTKTEVTVDGVKANLSDLKAGERVTVSPATGTATKIAVHTKAHKKGTKGKTEQPAAK